MGHPIARRHTTGTVTGRIELPAFVRTRRALIRFQAARATRQIIDELIAQPEPRCGRPPTDVRLDALSERYATLGGDPADLLGRAAALLPPRQEAAVHATAGGPP